MRIRTPVVPSIIIAVYVSVLIVGAIILAQTVALLIPCASCAVAVGIFHIIINGYNIREIVARAFAFAVVKIQH